MKPLLRPLHGALVLFADMKNVPLEQVKRRSTYLRDLLSELVARDIKLRYKRSTLGIAWSLLNPLAQLLIFTFVFTMLLPLNIPNYVSFLFTGILVWSWFHSSLLSGTAAVVENRDLVRRPGFPAAILPAVTVTSYLIHFLIALPILLVFVWLSGSPLNSTLLTLPLVIVLQFLLTVGLALIVSASQVRFRDTQYLLTVLLPLLMWLSPVLYDANSIASLDSPLYYLNPITDLLDAYRAIILQGEIPNLLSLLYVGVLAAVLLGIGYSVFLQASSQFSEEL